MHACSRYKFSVLLGGPILASILFAKFGPPRGTIFGKGGPILAAKTGPGGPVLAIFLPKLVLGDHFWQGGTDFGSQNWSGGTDFSSQNWSGGTSFGNFFAKIGPGGPILGGTDFGVTGQYIYI